MKHLFHYIILLSSFQLCAQFEEPVVLNDTWISVRYVTLEDLNEDSYPDIVVGLTNDIFYFLNDGNGNFDDPINLDSTINRPNSIKTGDIDNDGDLDLLVASGNATNFHRVFWMENDGSFNFSKHEDGKWVKKQRFIIQR